jgi:hypothetical protein
MRMLNAVKQLRGPKHENWPVWGRGTARALPRMGNMALEVVKMGTYSTRKWGDRCPILLTNLAQCVWRVGANMSR